MLTRGLRGLEKRGEEAPFKADVRVRLLFGRRSPSRHHPLEAVSTLVPETGLRVRVLSGPLRARRARALELG